MYLAIYTYKYKYVYICIYVYNYMYMYVCIYIYVYIYLYVCDSIRFLRRQRRAQVVVSDWLEHQGWPAFAMLGVACVIMTLGPLG